MVNRRSGHFLKALPPVLLLSLVSLAGCGDHPPPGDKAPASSAVPAVAVEQAAEPPALQEPELHVVSVQRGTYPPGTDTRPWWAKCKDDPSISESQCHSKYASLRTTGHAEVSVSYTAAPVVLALLGSDPVEWTVNVAPGVVLRKVILAGQYPQTLKGLPQGIPVEVHNRQSYGCDTCSQVGPGFHGHDPASGEYRQAMQQLRTIAGRLPASLQVSAEGGAFSVSPSVMPYAEMLPAFRAWEAPVP